MRQVTMYLCNRDPAHCTFQSTDRDAVIQHECGQHLHISVYAYEQWKTLTRKAESAGHAVGVCKTRKRTPPSTRPARNSRTSRRRTA